MSLYPIVNEYKSNSPFSAANLIKIIMEYHLIDKHKYSIFIDNIHHHYNKYNNDCVVNIHIFSRTRNIIENKMSLYVESCDDADSIQQMVEDAISLNNLFDINY
jgi:hypothetical protein